MFDNDDADELASDRIWRWDGDAYSLEHDDGEWEVCHLLISPFLVGVDWNYLLAERRAQRATCSQIHLLPPSYISRRRARVYPGRTPRAAGDGILHLVIRLFGIQAPDFREVSG